MSHGKYLADNNPNKLWGWDTPAGKLRARRRAELIIGGIQMLQAKRILEIGCGSGIFTEFFAESGADIVAVDISPDLLAIARSRKLPFNRVQFLEKRFEDCIIDGPFDAVVGSSVLHHCNLKIALPKIFELLKPGGILSFAEPNMLNPQVFLERKFRRFFSYVSAFETAFIRTRIRRKLQIVGFEDISLQPFDWLHPSTPPLLIPTVTKLGTVLEKIWPFKEFAGSLYIRACRPNYR